MEYVGLLIVLEKPVRLMVVVYINKLVAAMRESVRQDPTMSTRRRSQQLGISDAVLS